MIKLQNEWREEGECLDYTVALVQAIMYKHKHCHARIKKEQNCEWIMQGNLSIKTTKKRKKDVIYDWQNPFYNMQLLRNTETGVTASNKVNIHQGLEVGQIFFSGISVRIICIPTVFLKTSKDIQWKIIVKV